MKRIAFIAVAASLLVAAPSTEASAATIIKSFNLTGDFASGTSLPSSASVIFTLNFDNSVSFGETDSAISQISNNLYGPLRVAYSQNQDRLILVGGPANFVGFNCSTNPESFCTFINNVSGPNANSTFIVARDAQSPFTFATNVQLNEVAVAAAVPEPSTWLMMLFGFGMIGYGMRTAKRRSDEKFETKIKNLTYGIV